MQEVLYGNQSQRFAFFSENGTKNNNPTRPGQNTWMNAYCVRGSKWGLFIIRSPSRVFFVIQAEWQRNIKMMPQNSKFLNVKYNITKVNNSQYEKSISTLWKQENIATYFLQAFSLEVSR